jgi:hypothetical protein
MSRHSIRIGLNCSIQLSTHWPGIVLKIDNAKKRADKARLAAASKAPKVNTVQYMMKRPNFGRAVGTRQIRLNAASMPLSVINRDTTKTMTPTAVS